MSDFPIDAAAQEVVELGEGITFVRRLTHAMDMAAEELKEEADRDALQQLCTAISDRLRAMDDNIEKLDDMLYAAKTKEAA